MNAPEPGLNYRLVKRGESLMEGDEYYSQVNDRWVPTADAGLVLDKQIVQYRRKIEPQQEGWIRFDEITPLSDASCWLAKGDEVIFAKKASFTMDGPLHSFSYYTHWQYAKVPAPPPIEDPSRMAFEAHVSKFIYPGENSAKQTDWELWQAAVEWQRKQKQ